MTFETFLILEHFKQNIFLTFIIEQVALNKLSLPPKIIFQNRQKLQLFAKISKTESIYKSH